MVNALVITAPDNLSAPLAGTPRRLHTFPQVTPTRRWVASQLASPAIGGNVASWPALDASATFVQATAGQQPTLERVNNVYGVKFDAVDDIMGAGNGSAPDTAYSVIAVLRTPVVTAGKAMLNFRGNFFGLNASSIVRLRGSADLTPAGAPAIDTGLHFIAAVINGASSICRYDSYVATGDPGVQTTSTQLAMASGCSSAFAEIAYFNTALSDAQLQAIRTDLKKVYLTLP